MNNDVKFISLSKMQNPSNWIGILFSHYKRWETLVKISLNYIILFVSFSFPFTEGKVLFVVMMFSDDSSCEILKSVHNTVWWLSVEHKWAGSQRANLGYQIIYRVMVSINNLALKTAVNSKHYVILGAGFTGLCAAHFIKKKHPYCRITIIEASDRVGGWVNSYISPSGAVHELGPRSIRYTYNGRLILNLISDLGLQDRIATPSGGAYNR